MGKIKSFCDLDAWQEAHRLVLMVYQVTKAFPSDERFGLAAQCETVGRLLNGLVISTEKRL
jgi:hypothetical protein